jgi:Zn ribbon nucleic-acid-binding protein
MTSLANLKFGVCPQCKSNEVYTTKGKYRANYRSVVLVSALKAFHTDTYACIQCGYFEEYIMDKDLQNKKIIQKVKKEWKKV